MNVRELYHVKGNSFGLTEWIDYDTGEVIALDYLGSEEGMGAYPEFWGYEVKSIDSGIQKIDGEPRAVNTVYVHNPNFEGGLRLKDILFLTDDVVLGIDSHSDSLLWGISKAQNSKGEILDDYGDWVIDKISSDETLVYEPDDDDINKITYIEVFLTKR